MNKIEKIRNFKYAGFIIALLFALSIIFQCGLFHFIVYDSLVYKRVELGSFILRVAFALFFCALSLIIKRKSWIVYVSAIFAFWSMAELVYFRSNNIFIEEHSITMVGNMAGVWDSIWVFSKMIDWLLLLPTILLGIVVWFFKTRQSHISSSILVFVLSFLFNWYGCMKIHAEVECFSTICEHKHVTNPFYKNGEGSLLGFTTEDYVKNTSVLHSFIFQIKELVMLPFTKDYYELPEEDKLIVEKFINHNASIQKPQTPIIILLIESFESWTISPSVTPNLYKFINESQSMLYTSKMEPQVRHGVSADGQMIVNTGLLPVTDGATCFRFPGNEFPAISKLYESPALNAALSLAYWNQKFMSDAYGIKKNYVVESWFDQDMFSKVSEVKSSHDYLMSLTMTMHAPFKVCPEQEYPKVEGMPDEIYRYLNSVKYMDKCLGVLLDDLMTNKDTREYTIVITADHNVLSKYSRDAFNAFNNERNLGFGEINGNIPFIVYSPKLQNKIVIEDIVYQMDIYPTLLSLIGCDDYYWKGFGVNLLNEGSWNNRPIQAHEAQILSDKIIRANYLLVK